MMSLPVVTVLLWADALSSDLMDRIDWEEIS
jgi:hypothetical protein